MHTSTQAGDSPPETAISPPVRGEFVLVFMDIIADTSVYRGVMASGVALARLVATCRRCVFVKVPVCVHTPPLYRFPVHCAGATRLRQRNHIVLQHVANKSAIAMLSEVGTDAGTP